MMKYHTKSTDNLEIARLPTKLMYIFRVFNDIVPKDSESVVNLIVSAENIVSRKIPDNQICAGNLAVYLKDVN